MFHPRHHPLLTFLSHLSMPVVQNNKDDSEKTNTLLLLIFTETIVILKLQKLNPAKISYNNKVCNKYLKWTIILWCNRSLV